MSAAVECEKEEGKFAPNKVNSDGYILQEKHVINVDDLASLGSCTF